MDQAHAFLQDLAVILCVAAVTTVVFQRLRQPVVLGYLLAGMLVGPHVAGPALVADLPTVRTLAELGVILLMFSLGLDFSLRRLVRLGPRVALVAAVEVGLMLTLGFLVGQLLGWSPLDSILAGAIVAISSTMIVARVMAERPADRGLHDLVFGVLVMEDLVAIILIAVVTAVAAGENPSATMIGAALLRLVAFLAIALVIGLMVIPRAIRAIVRLRRPETTLVASIGLCFAAALGAQRAGYSVALGAFLAGSLVAESGAARQVEPLVRPVRDMFTAIFFVAVGALLDPELLRDHVGAVAALLGVVLVGKVVGVTIGAFLTGHGTSTSLRAGMTLAQIGEFSFIIAGVGLQLGSASGFLYQTAIAVTVITAFTTPWMIRASEPLALFVDRRLPKPLQTFVSLYGSWIELVRAAPRDERAAAIRRRARFLVADAALLAAVIIGTSLNLDRTTAALAGAGLAPHVARGLVLIAAALLALPFAMGIVGLARRLGFALAERALPPRDRGKVDPALAPRRALIVTLQIAIVMMVGLPLLAVTQPFLPPFGGPVVVLATLLVLGIAFWRTATDLEGHMRAGAQIIVEALAPRRPGEPASLEDVAQLLPGLGTLVPARLGPASAAAGHSLAELNVRGRTGATAVALLRGSQRIVFPAAREVLQAGDVVALSGSHDAIAAAARLLEGEGTAVPAPAAAPTSAGGLATASATAPAAVAAPGLTADARQETLRPS